MRLRDTAKDLFLATLHRLRISEVMRSRIKHEEETLHLGELVYSMQSFRRVIVISVGKAAAPMWDSLLPVIEPTLRRGQSIDAIVIGATRPQRDDSRVAYFHGSHPFPDQTARDAADAILNLLAACDETCLVIFLVSGGASAMVEKALDNRMTVEDEAMFHKALVRSGLPITQMNALRKHFSQVKGGRLAVVAQGATQCTLLVSDVPEKMLHIIGSGPSLPDPSTVQECRQIIHENLESLNLPDKILEFFSDPDCEETPTADHPAFEKASWFSLLSSEDLYKSAGELADRDGFHVVVDNSCDDWDYRNAATYLLDRLWELRGHHRRVCLLSAGEVSVQIPAAHGSGGRNQQFVLECARQIVGRGLSATVLSGGSDGVDGDSPAAGAVCDETTFERAAENELDLVAALESFDSFTVFSKLGDAIVTGPTGNNVRDLRILLSET